MRIFFPKGNLAKVAATSRSLRTLVRGSKIAFPEKGDTIRFFLWWKEGEAGGKHTGRADLDLSAVLYGADWWYKERISYTYLRSAKYRACHSGDITSAPEGACEFIDIDVPSVLSYGGRYVMMSVNSYTRQRFSDLPECRAGWMMREHPNSGEVVNRDPSMKEVVDLAMAAPKPGKPMNVSAYRQQARRTMETESPDRRLKFRFA